MSFPQGLHVLQHRPDPGSPAAAIPPVVLVHGSLDRADSFRRVIRRLADRPVVTYDRRGYAGSRAAGPTDLHGHVADLVAVVAATGTTPVVAVGHSYGGDVVIAAALARPELFAAIGAFEPPMPWLGFRRQGGGTGGAGTGGVGAGGAETGSRPAPRVPDEPGDPGEEAEQFFRRMVGDATWDRLPATARADRRADGPGLVGDLRVIRGPAPFDVLGLRVPVVFGRGGRASAHHREGTAWLAANVPGATLLQIEGASHGAHLSHPDRFAALVRAVAARDPGPAAAGRAPAGPAAGRNPVTAT